MHPSSSEPRLDDPSTADGHSAARRADDDVTIDAAPPLDPEPRAAPSRAIAVIESQAGLGQVERGNYERGAQIAHGGMGSVIAAWDRRLGRQVAIKELLPSRRDGASRFEAEARITARLQHPSIIQVYEAGRWPGGEPFIAMNLVAGHSLDRKVRECETFTQRLALLPRLIAVADALAYAHSRHIIHRDLKPSNVLVGDFGQTVVIDWGLAKDMAEDGDAGASDSLPRHRLEGSVIGTPAYMPPEQAAGEPVDERADVYAVGAMLYKVLCGVPPYSGEPTDIVTRVLAGPPIDIAEREAATPPDLVAIVRRAMSRAPSDRYPSARELAADLRAFDTGQLVAARKYSTLQLVTRFVRRHLFAAMISAILLAVAAWFYVQNLHEKNSANEQRDGAERRRTDLLEERGRTELLDDEAGPAFAYLIGALEVSRYIYPRGAHAFLLAEALRRFDTPRTALKAGDGDVLVTYRPGGTELATASRSYLSVWDAAGVVRAQFSSRAALRALAWAPTAPLIATASDEGVVLRSLDGSPVPALAEHTKPATTVEFSPDGMRLVGGGADGAVRLWDLRTGALRVVDNYGGAVTAATFRPDGRAIASASRDGLANAWIDRDGRNPERKWPLRRPTAATVVMRWSRDGLRVLTAGTDGVVMVWDPTKGKGVVQEIRHDRATAIRDAVFSDDGARVLTAGDDRTARLWALPPEPASNQQPAAAHELVKLQHADSIAAVTLFENRWIATAGSDRVAKVWTTSGRLVAQFEHSDAIHSLAFNPDGTHLAIGARDGKANIWEFQAALPLEGRIDLASPVRALAVSPGGHVVAGTEDSNLTSWRAGSNRPESVVKARLGLVLCVAVSSDGALVASGGEGQAQVWHTKADRGWIDDRAVTLVDDPATTIRAIAFSPDGRTVATGDLTGTMRLWDARTGTPVAAPPNPGAGPIYALAFEPSGRLLVAASEGGILQWDRQGHPLGSFPHEHARALSFSPSGTQLVVGGSRSSAILHVHDRGSDRLSPAHPLTGAGTVAAVAVTPTGLAITAGAEGLVSVWDLETGRLLARRDPNAGPIHALAFDPDREVLWTGTEDGSAQSWNLAVSRLPVYALELTKPLVRWTLDAHDVATAKRRGDW